MPTKIFFLLAGNLGQLYSRFGWDFVDGMGEKYNKVVRFHGLFGVRFLDNVCHPEMNVEPLPPKAPYALCIRSHRPSPDGYQRVGRLPSSGTCIRVRRFIVSFPTEVDDY